MVTLDQAQLRNATEGEAEKNCGTCTRCFSIQDVRKIGVKVTTDSASGKRAKYEFISPKVGSLLLASSWPSARQVNLGNNRVKEMAG